MKLEFATVLRACLVLAAIALQPAHGQTPPAKDKLVSRDELRSCMKSETELAERRKAVEARAGENRDEATSIKTASDELVEERKRVESDPNQLRMDRFERKVKAHNARIKTLQDKADALRGDLETLNKSLVAHNDQCGGISYRKEDKDAILQERAGTSK
jgi:chromosome segregation ATPase